MGLLFFGHLNTFTMTITVTVISYVHDVLQFIIHLHNYSSELGTVAKENKITRSCVPPEAFARNLPALQAVHTDAPLA